MRLQSFVAVSTLLAALASVVPAPVYAQGAPQTISAVDVRALATGYRSSKIVGSTVLNDSNQSIGKIDDLIVSRDHNLFAIVSVGGFLGMGKHLIVVSYAQLHPTNDNHGFVLPGATKDALKALPEYKYQS
jgi:hypothetical protein